MAIRLPMRMLSVALVLAILAGVLAPAMRPKKSEAFLLEAAITVGAVWLIGKITKDTVDHSVDKAEGAAKDTMQEAAKLIEDLLAQLETTYGNALDTTLDSLDEFTGQTLAKVAKLFDEINAKLMEDVKIIEGVVIDLLNQLSMMINQVMNRLEDLIVVAVRGAAFVVDKTTFNLAFLIAVILLLLGLLVFIWMLWTKTTPQGWVRILALSFMTLYLLFCGALFVPQTRVYAITMVGQAEQIEQIKEARIFAVLPGKVRQGSTVDFTLVGSNFDAGGEPKVVIGGQEVAPRAWTDDSVVVRLTGTLAKLSGPQNVAVKTADGKKTSPAIVEFLPPPPPPPPAQVIAWEIVPFGMVRKEMPWPLPETYLPGTGMAVKGDSCSSLGKNKCATYPAENLQIFQGRKPMYYILAVKIRDTAGKTVEQTANFTPGATPEKITVDGLSVWMENSDLWVQGTILIKIPPIVEIPAIKLPQKGPAPLPPPYFWRR